MGKLAPKTSTIILLQEKRCKIRKWTWSV